MRRRDLLLLLAGTAAMRPLGAMAQQSAPIVGFLFIGNPVRSAFWLEPWRKAMAEAGFVEGRNFTPEFRWGDGDVTRLPAFAADLVTRRVTVIVTATEAGAVAAQQATTTIPIVFNYVSDPVGKGLVKSFARPGGNITGIADRDHGAMESKKLQLLHQIIPTAPRIGYLVDQDGPTRRGVIEAVKATGKTLGVEVGLLTATKLEEVETAFSAAKQRGMGGLLVQSPATFLYAQQKRILEAAARYGLPVASSNIDFAVGGGLIEYGGLSAETPHLTADYVVRILKGQKAAELPVQQATKTRLVLNLKTARALGLAFPPALLASADEVIE